MQKDTDAQFGKSEQNCQSLPTCCTPMIPAAAAAGYVASFKKLWLHILLQASCKTATETVPFCFRNQHKSLAQSITSPHTGNSFTLYSLYTLLQITTAVRAFQKSPTKLPVQRQTSASPKKVKIVCFQTSISLTPEAYKSFNVPIRRRIKLQPASQVF